MSFRIMPNTTIRISDINDRQMETVAKRYDAGNKGYLTTQEAFALFADHNQDTMPSSVKDVVDFLGGPQHKMTVHHQGFGEVMSLPWHAHDWAGDFSIPGLGAGNVRTGGLHNWERPNDPLAGVILFDCNLIDLNRLEKEVISATIVMGPEGFSPESGSDMAEAVEIPLTLATQPAHQTWNRGGTSKVPEQKFLAAAIDIDDMKALGGGKGVSFYVRLETTEGTKYINKDGVPGRNFEISSDALTKYGAT